MLVHPTLTLARWFEERAVEAGATDCLFIDFLPEKHIANGRREASGNNSMEGIDSLRKQGPKEGSCPFSLQSLELALRLNIGEGSQL